MESSSELLIGILVTRIIYHRGRYLLNVLGFLDLLNSLLELTHISVSARRRQFKNINFISAGSSLEYRLTREEQVENDIDIFSRLKAHAITYHTAVIWDQRVLVHIVVEIQTERPL